MRKPGEDCGTVVILGKNVKVEGGKDEKPIGGCEKSTCFLEKFIFLFQAPDFFILILNGFAEHNKVLGKAHRTFWSMCTVANI